VCEPEISAVSKFSAFDVYAAIETSYWPFRHILEREREKKSEEEKK
jgi:hypothetical protein